MSTPAFDPKKPHAIMCGEPGVAFKQGEHYYNQAGKPAVLAPRDNRSDIEKERDELKIIVKEKDVEIATLNGMIAKLQLEAKPVVVAKAPVVESKPIVVDTAPAAPVELKLVEEPATAVASPPDEVVAPVDAPVVETPVVEVPAVSAVEPVKVKRPPLSLKGLQQPK